MASICPTCTDLFCHCKSIQADSRVDSSRIECITASLPFGPLCVVLGAIMLQFAVALLALHVLHTYL